MRRSRGRIVAKRNPFNRCVIVCEGTETEPTYFQRLNERFSGLKLKTPRSQTTDPEGLVRTALSQIAKWDLDLRGGDQLWCVFDADGNSEGAIQRAIGMAKGSVRFAFSNPCFELWFLLHYEYFSVKTDRASLIERLKRHIPNYEKTADLYGLLKDMKTTAIKRAVKLEQLHRSNDVRILSLDSNPSTQAHELVTEIERVKANNIKRRKQLFGCQGRRIR